MFFMKKWLCVVCCVWVRASAPCGAAEPLGDLVPSARPVKPNKPTSKGNRHCRNAVGQENPVNKPFS
jgi:hypothetical protein